MFRAIKLNECRIGKFRFPLNPLFISKWLAVKENVLPFRCLERKKKCVNVGYCIFWGKELMESKTFPDHKKIPLFQNNWVWKVNWFWPKSKHSKECGHVPVDAQTLTSSSWYQGVVDFSVMESTLTYGLPRGLCISDWFKVIVIQDLPTSGSALLAYPSEVSTVRWVGGRAGAITSCPFSRTPGS